jgi:hypothetical protein
MKLTRSVKLPSLAAHRAFRSWQHGDEKPKVAQFDVL